jgi:uncharacterized protein YxjI
MFSWGGNFSIFDQNGNECYYSDNPVFSWKDRASIFSKKTGELVLKISQKPFAFRATYYIYDSKDKLLATVYNTFQFFRIRMNIESYLGNFELKGEFMSREYTIEKNGNIVCNIHKKMFTMKPMYEVQISDDENVVLYIGILVALNLLQRSSNNHASSSAT